MWWRPLRFLQLVGWAEGTSFLVLLLAAMPLKYWGNWPHGVQVVGMAHGILWVVYLFAAFRAWWFEKWSIGLLLGALVASVLPLGPFVFDWWLNSGVTRHDRTPPSGSDPPERGPATGDPPPPPSP